jgi:hypothetical protein
VILLPKGQRALERVVRERLHELRGTGHALISALASILENNQSARSRRSLANSLGKKKNQP